MDPTSQQKRYSLVSLVKQCYGIREFAWESTENEVSILSDDLELEAIIMESIPSIRLQCPTSLSTNCDCLCLPRSVQVSRCCPVDRVEYCEEDYDRLGIPAGSTHSVKSVFTDSWEAWKVGRLYNSKEKLT